MENLKQAAALAALNDMMDKGYLNICTIDKVGTLLGVNLKSDAEAYNILSTLHCVDFGKLPKCLRDYVPELVQRCLGVEPTFRFKTLDQKVIDVSPEMGSNKPKRNLFRLLTKGAK